MVGQLEDGNFLGNDPVGAGFQAAHPGIIPLVGGEHEDVGGCSGMPVANVAAHLDTVHPRHHHVKQDEIGAIGGHGRQGIGTVEGGAHIVTGLSQDDGAKINQRCFVVDDQDFLVISHLIHFKPDSISFQAPVIVR